MIECRVVFDGNEIHIGKMCINRTCEGNEYKWDVYRGDEIESMFHTLEQAIKYCMEN